MENEDGKHIQAWSVRKQSYGARAAHNLSSRRKVSRVKVADGKIVGSYSIAILLRHHSLKLCSRS